VVRVDPPTEGARGPSRRACQTPGNDRVGPVPVDDEHERRPLRRHPRRASSANNAMNQTNRGVPGLKEWRASGEPVLAEVGAPFILSLGVAGYRSVMPPRLRGGEVERVVNRDAP
jgi:hypothetical protein